MMMEESEFRGYGEFGEGYGMESREALRVLYLEGGFYWQDFLLRVRGEGGKEGGWERVEGYPVQLRKRGNFIDRIPFYFCNYRGMSDEVVLPPLAGVVDLNVGHFRNSVDYEAGLHYAGLPTAWISGFVVDGDRKFYVGTGKAWVSENPAARAGYLEFSGQGLEPLARAMERKECQMAALGARLLMPPKREAESAEAKRLDNLGEQSVLGLLAVSVSDLLVGVVGEVFDWRGGSRDVGIALRDDFSDVVCDVGVLREVFLMYQSGVISYETFFYNLVKMGVVSDEVGIEEERVRLESSVGMGEGEEISGN